MTIKIIRNIARFIMGIVFIFSGFVKAIDPMGSTYKFLDYFDAFGLHFLSPLALVLAILLSSAELIIGLCLFLKIRMKQTGWALLLFMSFFTLLTLYSALTNPVTDCGCFGDAIILSNWQTFFKNLIIFIPTLIVFQQRNKFLSFFKPVVQWSITVILGVMVVFLSLHCYYNLPFIDFRPYHIGANIPASMEIPEGIPTDEYETRLIYRKDGIVEEFTLDSEIQPWNDSTWHWVETKNILVKSGYKPPIQDFTLTSAGGIDITDSVLFDDGYSFLVVADDLTKVNIKGLERINEFSKKAFQNGYGVYGMTSSMGDVIEEIEKTTEPVFEFFITDNITLKTMIRSNPGLMLIKEGNILGKWHFRNIPADNIFEENGLSFAIKEITRKKEDYFALTILLFIGSLSLILSVFRLQILNSKNGINP